MEIDEDKADDAILPDARSCSFPRNVRANNF